MMICATGNPGVFRYRPARRKAGFSLTELLIAIGVLGIGMGMVAALFVTGLAQVRMSLGTSEGGMVAANGIAVAKMFVTAGDVVDAGGDPATELVVIADGDNTTLITEAFQKSPYNDADTAKGFVILARECDGGAYQLVSVAYAKASGGTVTAQAVTSDADYNNVKQVAFNAVTYLNVGSPVIVAATGQYATITNLSGTLATLDHNLTIGSGGTAWVIIESGGGCPATGVVVTKTGLKP